MEHNVLAFCRRQSAKMIEYAEDCADPILKGQFFEMSDYWLSLIPAPNKDILLSGSRVTMPLPISTEIH